LAAILRAYTSLSSLSPNREDIQEAEYEIRRNLLTDILSCMARCPGGSQLPDILQRHMVPSGSCGSLAGPALAESVVAAAANLQVSMEMWGSCLHPEARTGPDAAADK